MARTRQGPGARRAAAAVFAAVFAVGCLGAIVMSTTAPAGADSTGAGSGGGTVSVGAGSGGGSGGSGGSGGGSPSGGGSGTSPWTCTYTYLALNNEGGFPNGGPLPGAWYSVTCVDIAAGVQQTQTVWVTNGPPAATPPVDPRAVALEAERSITLPSPEVRANPSGTSVVGLGTWLWIDPSLWRAESVTASAGPVSATAVARPVAVLWTTGDGSRLVCPGPGAAYVPSLPASWQTTDCAHAYLRTSAGQPSLDGNPDDGTFVMTATVEWSVSWTSTGVAGGGSLPTLYTTGASLLRVAQVESVNTAPGAMVRSASASLGSGS